MTDPKAEKMYTYLRGYAEGNKMKNTLLALPFSRKQHSAQTRRDGKPYIYHPLVIACYATSLGLNEDELIATILLHDVVEDCGVKLEHLPVSDAVKRSVQYMTVTSLPHDKSKMETKRRYYAQLLDNKNTFITKALDRQYNLSDMAGIFTPEQIGKNVHETETMFLPLFREAKEKWPELSDVFFVLKENIKQMNNTLYVLFTKEYNEYAEKIKGL